MLPLYVTNTIKDLLFSALRLIQKVLCIKTPAITILGYHAVSHDQTLIDITPDAFIRQIKYLVSKGYQFITLDEAIWYVENEKLPQSPQVVLTFDDGYEDLISNVAPMLEALDIPATYFVISQPENVDRATLSNDKALITRDTIHQLLQYPGSDIQAHTTSHRDLTVNSVQFIKNDLRHSIKTLESHSGKAIRYFAYPWGKYSSDYITALEESGFAAAFTTEAGFLSVNQNPFLYPRIMVDHTHSIEQFKFMLTPLYPFIVWLLAFIHKTRTFRLSIKEDLALSI